MSIDQQLPDEALIELVKEAAEGDTRPFEALVRRYEAKVMTNCRYLSGSIHDAEDLAQEVFVKVYFGLAGFEGRSSFETWVQRIKSNHCINFVKKKKLQTVDVAAEVVENAASHAPEVEKQMAREESRARIGEVLLRMNETLRIPLVLRDMDGMSYEEVGEQLGIGLSAVKMRIKRGRQEFRRLFDEGIDSASSTVHG